MKIKELQKIVNIAWSPEHINDIYLAAGTAAQQLDTSNSSSILEVYSTNLLDPGYDLLLQGTQTSKYRFQKVVWSPTGISKGSYGNGLIVGGCEGGHIQIYNASKLLSNNNNADDVHTNNNALIAHQNKHTGTVRGLDFNPFQHNLLASVASESEIFIWDLNNTTTPMSPGTKTQPLEDIQNVAWNKQVQHILSTVFSSKCVIWDLRKNEQIIKLNDTQSRVRWRAIQWHPDIATQLWLASEEDQAPYVQLWDLRYATAPAKTMQIHNRGILGLTWCPKDSDLMISCGKDNKIYCWNPNTDIPEGEILSEVATTLQWYSDVQWCPRNPALIASSSFDGNVSIYSLFGGSHPQVHTSNKIADSFPGMDQMSQAPPPQQQTTQIVYSDLKKTPKWMKKTSGISFGFGGRLLMFNQKNLRIVNICQVTTEPNLIQRSNNLEKTIDEGKFIEYCRQKADEMKDQHGRYLWYFLKANFESNPKNEMLNLLGYNHEDLVNKFNEYIKTNDDQNDTTKNKINNLTKQISVLSHGGENNVIFDSIQSNNKPNEELTKNELFKIPSGENNESLICQAILTGNIEAAAELCMEFNCPAEALIIASTAGNEFLDKIQKRYLSKIQIGNKNLSKIINALITHDWNNIAQHCTIDSWKEALVAALIHNDEQQTAFICDKLGERLQNEFSSDLELAKNSLLCYICSGNLEKLVESWLLIKKSNLNNNYDFKLNTDELQDLIEIIMLFKKSLELKGQNLQVTGKIAEFLSQYASLLAGQGALDSALSYLIPSQSSELEDLRERLYYALGHKRQQKFSQSGINQLQTTNLYTRKQLFNNNSSSGVTTNRFDQQRTNLFSNQGNMLPTTGGFNTGLPGSTPWNSVPTQQQIQQQQPSSFSQTWNVPPLNSQHLHTNYDSPVQPTMLPPPPSVAAAQSALPKPPVGSSIVNEGLNRPQRPSSSGSQGSTSLRSKYLVDPSVTSGPNYGQAVGVYNPLPSTFNNQPFNTSAPQTSTSVQNNFQPFTPAPIASSGSNNFIPNSSGYLSGISPIETGKQALLPPPPPPSSSLSGPHGGLQKNPTPPPGWNDPPVLKTRQQPKQENPTLNPITHPIFGVDPNQGQNGYNTDLINRNYSSPQGHQSASVPGSGVNVTRGNQLSPPPPLPPSASTLSSSSSSMYMTQNPSISSGSVLSPLPLSPMPPPMSSDSLVPPENDSAMNNIYNPLKFQGQAIQQQAPPSLPPQQSQMYQPYHETPAVSASPKPQEKSPLPEEFIYMQTVFDELKNQCQQVAPDPRTKRKFVDVTKRLEALYDALREKKLSQNTLLSLNQIVQYIQIGDYQNAMNVYMTIVSGPDFSQTANFMPGIKVLVQSASELKVYLR